MISNASQYAIRAVLYLAQHSTNKRKIGAKTLATELEVPQPFLAKLLQDLASKDLIKSAKGPRGGFYLSDSCMERPIWEVIHTIDGTVKFDQCFLGLSTCDDQYPCPVHHLVSPFKAKLLDLFQNKTIEQLITDIALRNAVLSLKDVSKTS